jgi:hypothetical protein
MPVIKKKYSAFLFLLILYNIELIYAGPPFDTDDPEPVKFKHWEYYISSLNNNQSNVWSGTAPHIEMNYGLIQNVQVHLLLPLNYNYTRNEGSNFGFADTEVGLKYRFIQETDNSPQVGVFPILEIPTIKNNGFSNGKTKIYLPLWLQKSWRKLTTYGGAGYWINPGTDNKNWIFTGWEIQYNFSETVTLGGELYFHTADNKNTRSETGFNLGGSINASEKFHFIFSFGHTVTSDNTFTSYLGLLWTI